MKNNNQIEKNQENSRKGHQLHITTKSPAFIPNYMKHSYRTPSHPLCNNYSTPCQKNLTALFNS